AKRLLFLQSSGAVGSHPWAVGDTVYRSLLPDLNAVIPDDVLKWHERQRGVLQRGWADDVSGRRRIWDNAGSDRAATGAISGHRAEPAAVTGVVRPWRGEAAAGRTQRRHGEGHSHRPGHDPARPQVTQTREKKRRTAGRGPAARRLCFWINGEWKTRPANTVTVAAEGPDLAAWCYSRAW